MHVLAHLRRGQEYLASPHVAVCMVKAQATNATDYLPSGSEPFQGMPKVLTPIAKEYGSDLVAFQSAYQALRSFIERDGK